jgi:hypothetical protein
MAALEASLAAVKDDGDAKKPAKKSQSREKAGAKS